MDLYTPEIKEQLKQWTSAGEGAQKKAKTVPPTGKVMVTVFWDSQGIIFRDYLEKGRIITGQYDADLLGRFEGELMKKCPIGRRKKCSFGMTTHQLSRYKLLPYPAYSPDLVPYNFLLFPNMTKWLDGKRFTSNEEVIAATEAYIFFGVT